MRVTRVRIFFDVDGESPDLNDSIDEASDRVLVIDIVEDLGDREFLASEGRNMSNKIELVEGIEIDIFGRPQIQYLMFFTKIETFIPL